MWSILILLVIYAAAPVDEWTRYGHDPALTGRSSLKGRITQPREAWRYEAVGVDLLINCRREAGEHRLLIPSPPTASAPAESHAQKETYHERWADLVPTVHGVERVAWNHTWTTEKVCRLQCFAFDQGIPRMLWETDPPEDTIFQPLDIIYDIDGDGVLEVLVAAHYRVMIFEGTTGRKETELRYHTSRPYGWFGLANVDDDADLELITLGDFQSHIDVLDFDRGKPEGQRLSVKWRRDIDTDISKRAKWPQIGPHPVIDVAGDARPEIILNLYNDSGDQQWHVAVLDAADGRTVGDLPGRFLQGVSRASNRARADLFLAATDGVFVPRLGRIELTQLEDTGPHIVWSADHAGWVTTDLPALGPTWSTTAFQGMRTIAVDPLDRSFSIWESSSSPQAADATPTPITSMTTMMCAGDDVRVIGRLDGLIKPARGQPNCGQIQLRLPPHTRGQLAGVGLRPTVIERKPLGITPSSPVAARLRPAGPINVIVEGPAGSILAIEPPRRHGTPPHLLWQRSGRGMADGSRALGPLAADLDGNGGNEIVVADQTPCGAAMLKAYRHDGATLWECSFPRIPGNAPTWNEAALTYWWPGRFRRTGQVDLFVNTRRGPMHSDVGQLIDGRDGSIVWTQTKAELKNAFTWGYAGVPPGVGDMTGDGLDDLVSLYPVCFWVADGRTGDLLLGKDLSTRKELPAWAAYGIPMLHDFTGGGRLDVLLDSVYILALLDSQGRPLWHAKGHADSPTSPDKDSVGETTETTHALIDLDGNAGASGFAIASAGYGDGARAIDPKDGRVLWACAAPRPTCPKCVAADIDGKPGDELLYVAGDTLVAITGDRNAGRILWTWQGPAALSMPAIADTDGDGEAEIIVQAADGTVICLDADESKSISQPQGE